MQLTLSPIRGLPGQAETILAISGDLLTCNGVAYDLSAVPEGGKAFPVGEDHPFIGAIRRVDGEIVVSLAVILGDDALPDQPDSPWRLSLGSGSVIIPALRKVETDVQTQAEDPNA
ncbi:hypothetical protein LCM17_06680 [Cereibacter sphaeroides]|nr:hypothetical protein [Cereibacter sphaeroides]